MRDPTINGLIRPACVLGREGRLNVGAAPDSDTVAVVEVVEEDDDAEVLLVPVVNWVEVAWLLLSMAIVSDALVLVAIIDGVLGVPCVLLSIAVISFSSNARRRWCRSA